MKQTAVEWLQKQLECFGNKHELQMSWATVDELLEQAKAMEKEQIVNAYNDCEWTGDHEDGEQYYNETFKSE
jgi:glucose-6-phosphate 1-dehydrogenase